MGNMFICLCTAEKVCDYLCFKVALKVADLVDVTAAVLQVWPQSLLHLDCIASVTGKL